MCFVSCLGAFDLSIYSTCGSLALGAAAAESLQETLEGLPAAQRSHHSPTRCKRSDVIVLAGEANQGCGLEAGKQKSIFFFLPFALTLSHSYSASFLSLD